MIRSWDDVNEALAQIARLNGDIAQAKADADDAKEAIGELEPAIEAYVRENEAELLERTRALDHGRVWLRKATRLKLIGRYTWKKVLDALVADKRRSLIRTKPEVDKEAIDQLSDEQLSELRVKRETRDVFGYEAV